MKQNRRRISGLCTAALLLCVGCRTSDEEVQPADDLMRYIAERYPEDSFTWVCNELRSEGSSSGSFGISAKSAKFPDADIRVARWKDGEKMVYADNYMAYYLQSDVEAYMHAVAEEYFGECKVFMHASSRMYTSEKFPTDATAEDYLKSKPQCIITVFLSPERITLDNAKEKYKQFEAEFAEQQYEKVGVSVYWLPDAESYEKTESDCGPTGSLEDLKNCDLVGRIHLFHITE